MRGCATKNTTPIFEVMHATPEGEHAIFEVTHATSEGTEAVDTRRHSKN